MRLLRIHKPIGFFLLLWPTLWALWLAHKGFPPLYLLRIFIIGTFMMRAVGCVINDWVDKDIDPYVVRTQYRPLAQKEISSREVGVIFFILSSISLYLVLKLNFFSILLGIVGWLLTLLYPFSKRYIKAPQCVLGLIFAWGIIMAFAATINTLTLPCFLLYTATVLWIIAYDTEYAMVDKADDEKLEIYSTAILFGKWDKRIIFILKIFFLSLLLIIGNYAHLKLLYYICLGITFCLILYQLLLIDKREPDLCFKAFLYNNWIGLIIFLGFVGGYI